MYTHTYMYTRKTEMRAVRTMIISKQTKKGRKRERKIARARSLLKVSTCVCNEHLPETKMKKKIGIHVPLCRMHFVHKIGIHVPLCRMHFVHKIGIHVPLCRMHFVHKITVTLECTAKIKAFRWLALPV